MEKQFAKLREKAGSWEKAAQALGITSRQLQNWRKHPEKLRARDITWIQVVTSALDKNQAA